MCFVQQSLGQLGQSSSDYTFCFYVSPLLGSISMSMTNTEAACYFATFLRDTVNV